MACSCLSQCFRRGGQEDIPVETSKEIKLNNDSDDFYLVQVGTRSGKRWLSSGLDLHDEIPIVPVDDSRQFWHLERDENSPLWTFHTKSPEGNKLYVTYDKENPGDQKVSLELDRGANNSSSRNFMLFLQPGGIYSIATASSLQRLLGANGDVLVLTDADHPTTEQEWIISNDLTNVVGQSITSYVHIEEVERRGFKWISANAIHGDRVPVSLSVQEEWIASSTVPDITFKLPTQDFYASKTEESEVEILYERSSTRQNMRKFKIVPNPRIPPPGVLLQAVSGDWYVGTHGSVLELKERDSLANGWYLNTTRMVFVKHNGEEDIFPAFKSVLPSVSSQ